MLTQQGVLSEFFGPTELHLIGIVSAALVLASLLYTVKRKFLRFPGSSALWLRVHQWGSLAATVLAVLHTDLFFFGMALVVMALMVAQAATGVIGSIILDRLPQSEAGVAKAVAEMRERFAARVNESADGTSLRAERARVESAERNLRLLLRWREVHVPLAFFFFAALTVHIVSIYYF